MSAASVTIGILLFDGCDVMDVTGPYEVFLTAERLAGREGRGGLFEVRTLSADGQAVVGYGGLGLVPSHGDVPSADDLDVLVVPGLIDLDAALADQPFVDAIRAASAAAGVTASVCTGTFLLSAAGVLGDLPVTTHWEDAADLAARRDGGAVRDDVRWVDSGAVVTSGGLSSGIAMALHLVNRFADRELAEATARQLDYVWTESRP
ncbi:DJ-1/PfpI family protein [Euzebya tangerina]|uniref:DJ-1/PfpI family protein n=1 Tax=Euzebya tangerina TaxID=591198 RepID=UPI000E314D4C|nr:DJ-1/PfpI family protein [Euzebya tangerina]